MSGRLGLVRQDCSMQQIWVLRNVDAVLDLKVVASEATYESLV